MVLREVEDLNRDEKYTAKLSYTGSPNPPGVLCYLWTLLISSCSIKKKEVNFKNSDRFKIND